MNKSLHKIIKIEYEKRRNKAQEDLEDKKQLIYSNAPAIEEIDTKIRLLGIKYNKLVLAGSKPFSAETEAILKEMDSLKLKKQSLLSEMGYTENYLEISYICDKCKDTGYIETDTGTEKCTCHKQMIIELLYNQSALKIPVEENFESFNEKYYSDKADIDKYKIEISPRENILMIKEKCLNFINNFDSPAEKNLFFSGPTGVGKTFLSNCIAHELLKRGKTVLYQTTPRLLDIIHEYKIRSLKDSEASDSDLRDIYDVDLLILDDLGTEAPTAARFTELLNILTERYLNNLVKPCKTIISTNMSIRELYQFYDERIVSRIVGNFDMLKFAGDDIRRIKKIAQA